MERGHPPACPDPASSTLFTPFARRERAPGPHRIEEHEFRKASTDHDTIAGLFPNLCSGDLRLLRLVPREDGEGGTGKPLRIGVVLSGGQAPGGHNVIAGIFDYLEERHPGSVLLGFKDGPKGVMKNDFKTLHARELVRRKGIIGCNLDGVCLEEALFLAVRWVRLATGTWTAGGGWHRMNASRHQHPSSHY